MIMVQPCDPNARRSPKTWCFLAPAQARVRKPDGTVVLVGYGIGDKVRVLDPDTVYCIPPTRVKEQIDLEDGSAIIEWWPHELHVVRERDAA